jgi:hypothetical protein
MNVATITMDPLEARRRLESYRDSRRFAADTEYQRAATAYEALAEGTPLIVLSEAIRGAPVDDKGRPRLSIARADRKQVHLRVDGGEAVYNTSDIWAGRARSRFPELCPVVALDRQTKHANGYALVPMVPPGVLGNRSLKTHFILWEVEQWADNRIGAAPDIDPYLLQRVADDLFAVVGEWDLTDVERAVMRDRART